MPTLPTIVLPKPYVLLTRSSSSTGILLLDSPNLVFGNVEAVYDTSDRVQVGQNVIFDIEKSIELYFGSTIFYMVTDDFIAGQETTPP